MRPSLIALQYIHRCFFAHALTTSADPMKSEYAPSFTAGYLSAKTMISSVKQQFLLFPKQICRFWVLWTHAFSSSVSERSGMWHVPKPASLTLTDMNPRKGDAVVGRDAQPEDKGGTCRVVGVTRGPRAL